MFNPLPAAAGRNGEGGGSRIIGIKGGASQTDEVSALVPHYPAAIKAQYKRYSILSFTSKWLTRQGSNAFPAVFPSHWHNRPFIVVRILLKQVKEFTADFRR